MKQGLQIRKAIQGKTKFLAIHILHSQFKFTWPMASDAVEFIINAYPDVII